MLHLCFSHFSMSKCLLWRKNKVTQCCCGEKNTVLAKYPSSAWNTSFKVHEVFPCRIINWVQQIRQGRVIRLTVQIFFAWYQLSEKSVQLLHSLVVSSFFSFFLFFPAWFPHLCAELWTPRVPQLSHWLFRLSGALFGLHNAAALQQGFPLPNSLRNVYLDTLTCWGGPRAWG